MAYLVKYTNGVFVKAVKAAPGSTVLAGAGVRMTFEGIRPFPEVVLTGLVAVWVINAVLANTGVAVVYSDS